MLVQKFVSRRRFLRLSALGTVSTAILAACSSAATTAPTATTTAAGQATQPAAAPAQATATTANLKSVPRNRTLVQIQPGDGVVGQFTDYQVWNPYTVAARQRAVNMLYEPLYFFSSTANKWIPWLAESHQYSPDFTELTIKIRSGVKWSDGTPFTAEDVAFTYSKLAELGPQVRTGLQLQQAVQEAKATDANTVTVKLKSPDPRFHFLNTNMYDNGMFIIPKHVFQDQDWTSFTYFDPGKGWPVTTSPWQAVYTSSTQKILDRRDDWWAVGAGLAKLPAVERVIWIPWPGEPQAAQAAITNAVDLPMSLPARTTEQMLAQNPKMTTFTGNGKPYATLDYWPGNLFVNTQKPPFDKPEVRWALSYFLDRDQIVQVGLAGAGSKSQLPMAALPSLKPYLDAVTDLLQKYDTNEFNPAKGAELLQKVGYTKGGDGFWVDAQGQRLKLPMNSPGFQNSGVVVSEQLKRQGIDASFAVTPDAVDQIESKGTYTAAVWGQGNGVVDPIDFVRNFMGYRAAAGRGNLALWKNDQFDKIGVDLQATAVEDQAKITQLFHQAMEVWLPELPTIPLTGGYLMIAMNTTYWTGWPGVNNPYVEPCFWHTTFPLMLNALQPAQ